VDNRNKVLPKTTGNASIIVWIMMETQWLPLNLNDYWYAFI